jgi:hypothetical protein
LPVRVLTKICRHHQTQSDSDRGSVGTRARQAPGGRQRRRTLTSGRGRHTERPLPGPRDGPSTVEGGGDAWRPTHAIPCPAPRVPSVPAQFPGSMQPVPRAHRAMGPRDGLLTPPPRWPCGTGCILPGNCAGTDGTRGAGGASAATHRRRPLQCDGLSTCILSLLCVSKRSLSLFSSLPSPPKF